MLATAMQFAAHLFDLRSTLRRMTVTAALLAAAGAALLAAIGFGLALLYIWLQWTLGTMPALAVIGGGFAILALVLLLVALLRPQPKTQPASRLRAAAKQTGDARIENAERLYGRAMASLQEGTAKSVLAVLVLALASGYMLGRRL
jgi:predicted RND superfamily exporter protein